jgi:FtsP/CotA-like multicopper oxidase with cupredoxin domain
MSLRLVGATALLSFVTTGATAAPLANTIPVLATGQAERILQAPPQLKPRAKPSNRALTERDDFVKSYDLYIRETSGTIYNPTTGNYDAVSLRAYQQTSDKSRDARDPNAVSFLAPTVVMSPGQTVRFRLYNQLPQWTQKQCANSDPNSPNPTGCFNVTNLHSHGLWVSPSGNSDNVLVAINPGVDFEYEYNIPVEHPAGTFWYHPHTHGSTAIQVASGMAGALVIEGDRYPTEDATGDLDVLLKKFQPAKTGSAGEVMLLQQIPYGCLNPDGTKADKCLPNTPNAVNSFDQVESPTAWIDSKRYTSINGKVQPVLDLTAQQLHRWRLVDTGFQASIKLRIRRAKDPQKLFDALSKSGEDDQKIVDLCDGEDIVQYEVASDGLTHEKIIGKTDNYLLPGYRSDILFALPDTGAYCVYDASVYNKLNPKKDEPGRTRIITVIRATANAKPRPYALTPEAQKKFIVAELISALNALPASKLPANVKNDIRASLYTLQLPKFVPHKSFSNNDILSMRDAKKEYVTFNIAKLGNQFRFMIEGEPEKTPTPSINNIYQHDRIDHEVILGTQQIWQLSSKVGSHPFHIHVNPFQIISITSTNPSRKDDNDIDPQYEGLVGTWKDTLLVIPGHKIEVATRYERYIGEYVLHCHILEHEDQGMMQNVKVVLPNGDGGASHGAHANH